MVSVENRQIKFALRRQGRVDKMSLRRGGLDVIRPVVGWGKAAMIIAEKSIKCAGSVKLGCEK